MPLFSVDAFASDPVMARQATALLDLVGEAAILLSAGWRIVHANARVRSVFGHAPEDLIGRDLWQVWPGAVGSGLYAELLRAARERVAVRAEHQFNGDDRSFAIRAEPIEGGLAVFALEITQHRQHVRALREAKEAAESANRAKDQFLAVLSHELRTPLTPALMAAVALEAENDLPPEAREDVAMIRRNIELETRLIDDLLDLSRIVSGKLALSLEDVPLHPLLRAVGQIVEAEATAKGITIDWDLSATVDLVRGDAARLHQVVWNLLKNAVKFTPQGGTVRVRTANPARGRVRIEVADDGVGIDPVALPRIFNAFEQGDAGLNRSFGGLGLGLAISKAIAEMHGAELCARSEGRGLGATFWLEMPLGGVPELLSSNLDLPAGALTPRPVRVLLVEDHPDTRNTLHRLLEMIGYAVGSAASMAEGLALAAAGGFDVLVSDIDLPDGTGWELLRQLRMRQNLLPAIAVSGFGMEEDVQRSTDAGFLHHLTKPVNIKELQAAIGAAAQARGDAVFRLPPT